MNWLSLALVLLKIANNIFAWVRSRQEIQAGEDAEIAKVSAAILMKTKSAKAIMEEVSGMSGADLDVLLHKLEQSD